MPTVLLLVAFAYLLGSVPCGWVVMKLYRNLDVRKLGSGNIGAANVFRAGGHGAFAATVVLDAMKGFIPVMLGIVLGLGNQEWALAAIGLAAVMGHTWPIYLRFRGGKGVATSGGVMLALAPVMLVISVLSWFLTARLTRLASLSSLVAAGVGLLSLIALHFVNWTLWRPVGWSVILLGVVLVGLIFYRHRLNIERLASGRELKLTAE